MKSLTKAITLLSIVGFAVFPWLISFPDSLHAQAIKTLSAGIGKEDRGAHKGYSLKLVFARSGGSYLAGIDVTILDAEGSQVVSKHSVGPWLFVNLPAGTYNLLAKRGDGRKVAAEFDITGERQKKVYLTW